MSHRRWSPPTLAKYALFQLPGIAVLTVLLLMLQKWLDLADWMVWGLVGLWVSKDAAIYPFVWEAYEFRPAEDENPMIGETAVAKEPIAPSGYVHVRGELWRAELTQGSPPVDKGQRVTIRAVHGLVLLVEPLEEAEVLNTPKTRQR